MSSTQRFQQSGLFRSADGTSAAAPCADRSRPIDVRAIDRPIVPRSGPTRACSPTPLRDRKIGAFLKRSFGSTVFSIYDWRRG